MSNYASGHDAEKVAAKYLENQGYQILGLNWKTRLCEVDIVARKNETIHFVEVKYRTTSVQGTGFDYITPKKLKQMRFAAELWVSQNGWPGEYTLSAVEVSGHDYSVISFVEVI